MVYMFFLGLAYTLKEKKHISVELVVRFIPSNYMNIIEIITNSIGIVISIIITNEGLKMFVESYTLNIRSFDVLRTPLCIPHFSIAWGGVFLSAQYAIEFIESLKRRLKPKP